MSLVSKYTTILKLEVRNYIKILTDIKKNFPNDIFYICILELEENGLIVFRNGKFFINIIGNKNKNNDKILKENFREFITQCNNEYFVFCYFFRLSIFRLIQEKLNIDLFEFKLNLDNSMIGKYFFEFKFHNNNNFLSEFEKIKTYDLFGKEFKNSFRNIILSRN